MNQTLIKKKKKMLPQAIRDIIKKEAEGIDPENVTHNFARSVYTAAATKYAELMVEFAEWCPLADGSHFTTSDLLTIFLKEKSNLANENNIV